MDAKNLIEMELEEIQVNEKYGQHRRGREPGNEAAHFAAETLSRHRCKHDPCSPDDKA